MCISLVFRQGRRLQAKFLEASFRPKLQCSVIGVSVLASLF